MYCQCIFKLTTKLVTSGLFTLFGFVGFSRVGETLIYTPSLSDFNNHNSFSWDFTVKQSDKTE